MAEMDDNNEVQNIDVDLESIILYENTHPNTEECEISEKILHGRNDDPEINNCEMTGNENTSSESNKFIEKTDGNENDNENESLPQDLQLKYEASFSVNKFSTDRGDVYEIVGTKGSVSEGFDCLNPGRKKNSLHLDVQPPQETEDPKRGLKQTEVLHGNRNSDRITREEQGKNAVASILEERVRVEPDTTPSKRSDTTVRESNLYLDTYVNELSLSQTEHKQQSRTSIAQVQKEYEEMNIENGVYMYVNTEEEIDEGLHDKDTDASYLNAGKEGLKTESHYIEISGEVLIGDGYIDMSPHKLPIEFATGNASNEERINCSRNDQTKNRLDDKDSDASNLNAGNNELKTESNNIKMSDGGSVDEENVDMRPHKLPIKFSAENAANRDRTNYSKDEQTDVSLHDKDTDTSYLNVNENELKTGMYIDTRPQQLTVEFSAENATVEEQLGLYQDDQSEMKESRSGYIRTNYEPVAATNDTDSYHGLDKHDLSAKLRSAPQLHNDAPSMSSDNHQSAPSPTKQSRTIQTKASSDRLTINYLFPESLQEVNEGIKDKTNVFSNQQSSTEMPSLSDSDSERMQSTPLPSRSQWSRNESDSVAFPEILSDELSEAMIPAPLNAQTPQPHTPEVHQVTHSNFQSTPNKPTLDSHNASGIISSQPPLTAVPIKDNNNCLAPLDVSPSLETQNIPTNPEVVTVERQSMRPPRKLMCRKTFSTPSGVMARLDSVFEPVSPSIPLTPVCSEQVPKDKTRKKKILRKSKSEPCAPVANPVYAPRDATRKSFVDSLLKRFHKGVEQQNMPKKVQKESLSSQNTANQTVTHDENKPGAQGADSVQIEEFNLSQTETEVAHSKTHRTEQGKTNKKSKMFGSTKRGSEKKAKKVMSLIEESSRVRDEDFEDFEQIQMYLAAKEALNK